jgi:hypothetical protein
MAILYHKVVLVTIWQFNTCAQRLTASGAMLVTYAVQVTVPKLRVD